MSRDLTKEEIDDLRASFDMFDKDKSGEFPWAEGGTGGGHGNALAWLGYRDNGLFATTADWPLSSPSVVFTTTSLEDTGHRPWINSAAL